MSAAGEGGPVVMDDWQPMSSAPNNATEVRVRTADGTVIERAHWACDLSGEEQPAFCGWFRPVTGSDGRVLHYVDIGEPVGWMAVSAPKVTEEKLSMEAIGALGETDVDNFPSPAAGQRYTCAEEEGFTLSRLEPGRTDTRYWITTDGRTVDMYAVSPRTGWSVELIATPESEGGLTGAASDVDPLLPADHPLATRPRREDAVGLVREPFKPSARAAAETLDVLARAGDDELARLLPGLAIKARAVRAETDWQRGERLADNVIDVARAAELLVARVERLSQFAEAGEIAAGLLARRDETIAALRARVAELESSNDRLRKRASENIDAAGLETLYSDLEDDNYHAAAALVQRFSNTVTRVAELEALLTAPPVGSMSGLLAKVETRASEERDNGSNYRRGDPDGDMFAAAADAFDEATRMIRSTLATPSPVASPLPVSPRWLALSPATRSRMVGRLRDELRDVRHEIDAEDIEASEALIDLASLDTSHHADAVGEFMIHARDDIPALLSHLDAIAAPADGEALGREVRDEWVTWAREQTNPKPSWLVPWEGLSEPDRDVDRRIGLRCHAIGYAAGALSREGEVAALRDGIKGAVGQHEESEADRNADAFRYETEIARVTAELESRCADIAQHSDEVATLARTIVRLTAELAATHDCGQADVCATPPRCQRHWEERNRELEKELVREGANYVALQGQLDQVRVTRAKREDAARADGAREERERLMQQVGSLSTERETPAFRSAIADALDAMSEGHKVDEGRARGDR